VSTPLFQTEALHAGGPVIYGAKTGQRTAFVPRPYGLPPF
jgi:hypothetical protein